MQGIAQWIDKRACMTPQKIALIGENRQLTYAEMSREVNRIARMLAETYDLPPGERVGIMATNSVEYLMLLFAIAKLGCIAVVLNIRLAPHELEFQLNDSGMKMLLAETGFREAVEQLLPRTAIENVIWFDTSDTTVTGLQAQISSFSPEHFARDSVNGLLPFIICYTSGTTGRPKGAVLTQQNMFWNALNSCLPIDITSVDKSLALLPLFHIGGIGLFAFPTLFAGGTVVVPNRFDPEKTLRMIEEHQVTLVMGVPVIFDSLRKCSSFDQTDLRSIRWFYSGGAPCPHELISFYLERGIPFGQGYGMTETSPTVFMITKEDYQRKIGSIGKPAMFCDIRVVDEQGREVAAGEVGELLVKGPNVMKEYWNFPDATGAALKDGWLSTGDLVRLDEEGFAYVAGRKKDMIISGGENIYPLEIEQVIGELPSVDEVAVVGIPHEKWGEVPIAVVVVKQEAELDGETVKNHCLKRLAKYKVPTAVHFASALAKNATGKIDKNAIKSEVAKMMEEKTWR